MSGRMEEVIADAVAGWPVDGYRSLVVDALYFLSSLKFSN